MTDMEKKINSPFNLLFLIYDLERGGPELRLLDLQKHLPPHFRIYICVTSRNVTLLPKFLEAHARIRIVPVKRAYLELHKAWSIYGLVKSENISTVNAFGLKELFLAVIIKIFSLWRLKIVYHAVETFDHLGFHRKCLFHLLLKSVNRVLCNSKDLKLRLRKLSIPEKAITAISNGIDTKIFSKPTPKKKYPSPNGLDQNNIIIGTIANFREEKNYPFLIEAFKALSQKHSHLRLLCVGGGILLPQMKNMTRAKGLEKQVVFTGYSESITKHLSTMDIFVLCSLREGFPNVLLQAMSMSIPVLSANVGGCSEIIDHRKNGMLYPSNNMEKFIDEMETLLRDKAFAAEIAANGRKTVEEKYSLRRMITDYGGFYKELTG